MRKKKFYEKPSTEVVMLQQQTQLLAGSTLQSLDDFQDGDDPLGTSSPSRMDDDMSWMLQ